MSGCRSKQEENPYIDGPINILAAHTIGFPQYYHLPFARPYLVCFDLINNPFSSQTQNYLQTLNVGKVLHSNLGPLCSYLQKLTHEGMNKWEISFIASVCTIVLLCSYYSILKSVCLAFRGATSRNRDRRRLMNEADPESNDLSLQFHSHGLESSILNSIPITQFEKKNEGSEDTERNTECAVCLGEFEEGEWLKHLPNCTHAFHVPCIDTWFQSHSNCPLCRSHVYDVDIHHESSVSLHTMLETLRREDFFHERAARYQILHSTIIADSGPRHEFSNGAS